ncbi:serine hydrolase domain-containing protein [Sulfidibacter corallicola]|uniref:Serine hydrolase n=1 Tax=Sulfidibacter corallicola TaxID=2818388 RepID=A0A8A4TEQ7_SULCO|nr:serine hydrolase [Sulfidibacter corallicola]QTD48027.1 serine hydrolase [Sulfidibacter corallicola]
MTILLLSLNCTAATLHYLPHFTVKDGLWQTRLSIHNPSSQKTEVRIRAYDDGGDSAGQASLVLPPRGGLVRDLETLLPTLASETGWLEIETDDTELTGMMVFTSTSGGSSSLSLSGDKGTHLILPFLQESDGWASGFALTNPNDSMATLTLDLLTPEGLLMESKTLEVGPRSKFVAMLAQTFSGTIPETAVLRLSSDVEVLVVALSFAEGVRQIVAVPAESFAPDVAGPETAAALRAQLQAEIEAPATRVSSILHVEAPELGLSFREGVGPVEGTHRFRARLVSGAVLAVLALQLAETGQLDLDAPIARYLAADLYSGLVVVDSRDHSAEITTRQLLAHRSGLPNLLEEEDSGAVPFINEILAAPDRDWTRTDLLAWARTHLQAKVLPGQERGASHLNDLLTVAVLESVTGATYDQMLDQRILSPLGMNHTALEGLAPNIPAPIASEWLEEIDVLDIPGFAFDRAAGALVTTTGDLITFFRALLKGALFQDPQTLDLLLEPVGYDEGFAHVGLGLIMIKDRDCLAPGARLIGATGFNGAFVLCWPERNLMVAGTSNFLPDSGFARGLEVIQTLYGPGACRDPGSLPRYATPEDAGFSADKLAQARLAYDATNSAAFLALYRGKVLVSWGDVSRRYLCHSIRKGFLSGLYGMFAQEGVIELDATLADLGIDDATPLTSIEKQATVADLLKARSGIYLPAASTTSTGRPARGSHAPGTHFHYNNWDFNALGTIFEQQTGHGVHEAFAQFLAEPLAMQDFHVVDGFDLFERFRSQHPAYHFRVTARDMARIGQLYLQHGAWDGRQVIPASWIQESTSSHSEIDVGAANGFGYMWWIEKTGGYSTRGSGGHIIRVIPEEELVYVRRVNTDRRDQGAGLSEVEHLILDAKLDEAP